MTIEKKEKYRVWTLEPDSACPVCAYIENGRVVAYHIEGDIEIYMPDDRFDIFFDSMKEADEYVTTRTAELKAKAKETLEILKEMDHWEESYDGWSEAPRLDDFIPHSVRERYGRHNKDTTDRMISGLARCARDRIIEVTGRTILMESISHVEWDDDAWKATIVLHDGTRFDAGKKDGYDLLKILYDHDRKR